MSAEIAELFDLSAEAFLAGFLVFLRIGAIMALVPAFGEQSVPQRVRLFLTLAMTAIVAPAVVPGLVEDTPSRPLLPAILAEVANGLALGIALRLLVMALQMAGTMAATAMSLSQLLGGAAVEPQPAISGIFVTAGLALAVMTGLHVKLSMLLIGSYEVLPLGRFPEAADLADWGVRQIARAFAIAFSFAAPFVVASLVYNMALGAINRAMPQLMVAFVGAPAITGGALVMLALALPLILPLWLGILDATLADPFGGP